MRYQWQAPSGYLHLGRVSVQRHCDPRAHYRGQVTDRMCRHLNHDGHDIAVFEVVRVVVKHVRRELTRCGCGDVGIPSSLVRSEQIRGQASENPHALVACDDLSGNARSDDLALSSLCGIPPGGPTHLESLHVSAFGSRPFGVPNLTEANLESHFLVGII